MAGKYAAGDKERGLELNPNLPRWVCQKCRHALFDVGVGAGVDSSADKFFSDSSRSGMQTSVQGSVMGSTTMDQSFVVLPKQRNLGHGAPPQSRSSTLQLNAMQPGKIMEESFLVLPPSAAFRYESDFIAEGGEPQAAAQDGSSCRSSRIHNSDFHSKITVLKRALEIATSETQVEQPICLECMRVLLDKFDEEVEDVNQDIKVYEACLLRSELESCNVLSDNFVREEQKFEEEEKRLQAEIEATEKHYAEVSAEMKELQRRSEQFKELEERYWHEFNEFQFQLISQQEERDAIFASIEVSKAHLELVKRIDVLYDAFTIWHDGEFGTINNFRLGRLPKIPVEWDEINAAWGQACHLLHTMVQRFLPKFSYRIKILPMGSYPHILDTSSNSYELFGPVNMFWSTRYDKAMTLFLTCLKEFAEFANSKDQENNIPLDKCFKLPYKIENDKVENYTITQSFNSQENWTKALKYTLCNLKWVWHWFVSNSTFQPLPAASG